MGSDGLTLKPAAAQVIRNHAAACSPAEACGFLAGHDGVAVRALPIANRSVSPVRFSMDPSDMVRAHYEILEAELDLLAVYHSHPAGPAGPSPIDVRELERTGLDQVIVVPIEGGWGFRAFRWTGGALRPHPIQEEA